MSVHATSGQIARLMPRVITHYRAPIEQFANVHEAAAYALWTRESKIEARKLAEKLAHKSPMARRGRVLTEAGWEIPVDPVYNPRVIEHDPKPLTAYQKRLEERVQREIADVAGAHEHAVMRGDVHAFLFLYRHWELPIRFYFEPVNVQ